MKIVVVGGTGLLGSRIVENLVERGQDVVSASPSSGVNTITGEGLAEALKGAHVVIDASNAPSFEAQDAMSFFEASTRRLLAAEAAVGLRHHVSLSVVGCEQMTGSGYFSAKVAQEALIKASAIPHSIVHSTQVFEFLERILGDATSGDTVRLPSVLARPIAAADLAMVVGGIALGEPLNAVVEVAGPAEIRLDVLAQKGLNAKHDPRKLVIDARAPYFGATLNERTLIPERDAHYGKTRFEEWLDLHVPATLM